MANNFSFDQNFDSDDEDQQRFHGSGRDACVVVIDCSASMFIEFEENEEATSAFLKSVSVVERLMSNKIVSNHQDMLGVVLYNTEKSPEPAGNFQTDNLPVVPKSCAVLLPMRKVESVAIQLVKNLKNSEDFLDFDNKFGHSKDAKISDILLLCSSIFSSCDKKIRVSTIMWFTNEDLPHQVGSSDHQQAFQKAKDLQQLQFEFQFFPMKLDFDGDLFYKELVCQLSGFDLEDYAFPVPLLDEKILLQRMYRRSCTKRALAHLTVDFSEKLKFGVGIYSFTRKAFVPKAIQLSRKTKEQITSKRTYKYGTIDEDDVETLANVEANIDFKEKLEPNLEVKYQLVGGEKIRFTKLEAYEIKQVMNPGIKVLGFKPSSVMSEFKHIKSAYFIYPNESRVKNSTVLFRALWERCLADEKIVVCIFTMRLKTFPRLVALVPQTETIGPDGETLRYDGFRMEFIPYAGDVRDLSEVLVPSEEVDENVSSAMIKIIKKLRANYAAAMLSNPVVSKIYAMIEEEVYNEAAEEVDDDITPVVEFQDDRIAEGLRIIEESIGLDEVVETQKRKAADSTETARKKIAVNDVDMDLVLQKCLEGNVKDITIPILKSYLKSKNATGISTLTKAQLVAKIIELS